MIKKNLVFFLCIHFSIHAQIHTRFEADVSIKERTSTKTYNLSRGKIYFDKTQNLLIYDMTFPLQRKIVIKDSISYIFEKGSLLKKHSASNLIAFSIYNLCLNGGLNNYGLTKTPFKLVNTCQDSGFIISTWKLPLSYKDSKIFYKLAHKKNQLVGILTYNMKNKIISRQIFSEYTMIQGINIPIKILQFLYSEKGEELKITSIKNIKLNNLNDKDHYKFDTRIF